MRDGHRKIIWMILGLVATVTLLVIAVVVAVRLEQIGTEPVAPTAPKSQPRAQGAIPTPIPGSQCRASWVIPTLTPTVQPTGTPPPTPTLMPTPTPTPTVVVVAQCIDLLVQVPDGAGGWVGGDLAGARPGDRVRFVATGSLTGGSFTEGAFFINGELYCMSGSAYSCAKYDVVKLDATHFAVEYTLTGGLLKAEAVLLHDSLGWVD